MKPKNRFYVRAALVVFACAGAVWFCLLVAPAVDESYRQTLVTRSTRVRDGHRFSIQSADWHAAGLELVYKRESFGAGQGICPVDRPWGVLYCLFWDSRGVKIGQEIEFEYAHDFAYVRGEADTEEVRFTICPPPEARFIMVQDGKGAWHTTKCKLPPKPVNPVVDLIRRLLP
jgi:hypothetical protein